MMNSVLLNIFSNAIKFTKRNEKIVVDAKRIENQLFQVSVSDSGIGIEKSLLEKLFIVGERIGHNGTEGELNAGLGLILCKEFVKRNGGKILAESKIGGGSTFYFTVPAKNQENVITLVQKLVQCAARQISEAFIVHQVGVITIISLKNLPDKFVVFANFDIFQM